MIVKMKYIYITKSQINYLSFFLFKYFLFLLPNIFWLGFARDIIEAQLIKNDTPIKVLQHKPYFRILSVKECLSYIMDRLTDISSLPQ